MVGYHDVLGKPVLAKPHDLVVLVEHRAVRGAVAAADDHVKRGGRAHQLREADGERRVAVLRERDLVGCDPGNIGPHEVGRAYGDAVVLVVAAVLLGEVPVAELMGEVHPQLAAHQAAVEDVVGVLVGLDDRLQQVLAFVKALRDAPLLQAYHVHLRLRGARFAVLQYVHVAAAAAFKRMSGERVRDASDVDVVDGAEQARRVEEEALHPVVAHREKLRVLRAGRLVEHRVEYDLAAVELRRDAGHEVLLLRVGLVRPARKGVAHLVAPLEVRGRLLAQVRRKGHAPRQRDLPAGVAERRVVKFGWLQLLERTAHLERHERREHVHLGPPKPVALVEAGHDLLYLAAEGVCGQPLNLAVAARGEEARPGRVVVVVERQVVHGDARLCYELGHVVLRNRLARHAPVLAAFAQRCAHLRGVRVQKAYDALRHHLLQLLVGSERKVHAVWVRADEHKVLGEDEVHRLGYLRLLLNRRQRLLLRKLLQPHQALHGVHALLRHKSGRAEKHSADAAQQLAVGVLREYSVSYYLHARIIAKSRAGRHEPPRFPRAPGPCRACGLVRRTAPGRSSPVRRVSRRRLRR